MSNERRVSPRMTEDLHFNQVDGPPRYARRTDKPVQYVVIVNAAGAVIGYVWANDEDDAAGWTVRPAGGDEAFNLGFIWATKLHEAKARGLAPTAALAEMIRDSDPSASSCVQAGSLSESPSLTALKELAAK
ncbi:hypothetical protein H9Y04_27820 [Streptomyces sp. TRM66268-LWL]|uniref:Uncharacterized protein n=1 Tax=Streptomyces polyasparticus TaxID=2767826 RepID=A0ABR7SNC0_9ACTN|nr:hypothetical protein [Streptomyces polyasparticus]MBC9716349.1 hypothetical protein [Streptomyces polyasparticus]